jgi:mono/diheme cytochrome c family protein
VLVASLLLAALPLTGVLAGSGEAQLHLQPGPGEDLASSRCIICHSLDYIPANAAAMDRAGWQKTVQKMRERFGAPISDEEAKMILDYLDAHYSGKS